MRDVNRINSFCQRLEDIWKTKCPQWRFGQMICNVFGEIAAEGIDPFFPEEDEMIRFFEKYFKN